MVKDILDDQAAPGAGPSWGETPDEKLSRSVRNVPDVQFVSSARLTARDVAAASRVIATKSAFEKLQEALA